MKHTLYTPIIMLLCLLISCTGTSNDSNEAREVEASADFNPEGGMSLQSFVDMPGIEWSFDTIKGICSPDTLVLWMRYNNNDYLTNVTGINGKYSLLTSQGEKKLAKNPDYTDFVKSDFTPLASTSTAKGLTRAAFKEWTDSMYRRDIGIATQMVKDFFTSLGMTKYMAEPMASNWRQIYAQAENEGEPASNPFNHGTMVEFESSSITATVVNASEGIVEVAAYCWDPYTVGRPGWGYWTVRICRDRSGGFKIKESPAQHRRFTTG